MWSDLPTVNMGQLWSDMGVYKDTVDMLAEQINSVQSYRETMHCLFCDEIYNMGRIRVWFYVSQNVYK